MNISRFDRQFSATEWEVVNAAFRYPVSSFDIPGSRALVAALENDAKPGERFNCFLARPHILSLQRCYIVIGREDKAEIGSPPRGVALYVKDANTKIPTLHDILHAGVDQAARTRGVRFGGLIFVACMVLSSPLINLLPLYAEYGGWYFAGSVVTGLVAMYTWTSVQRKQLSREVGLVEAEAILY